MTLTTPQSVAAYNRMLAKLSPIERAKLKAENRVARVARWKAKKARQENRV
jgi:hypothetical protein